MLLQRVLTIGLMLFPAGIGAAAAQDGSQLAVPVARWNLDYGEHRCALGRRLGGQQSPVFILSSYLGRDEPEIIIVRDGSERFPYLPRNITLVLDPDGQVEEARAFRYRTAGREAIRIEGIAEGFFDRFAASGAVGIDAGNRRRLTLRIPGARAAIEGLRACNDDLLRSWGIDVGAQATYRRQATIVRGSISNADYPAQAIRANQAGVVVVRMRVRVDGRASDCVVLVSSRAESDLSTTCTIATGRFRFDPALDAQGNPIETTYIQTVRWMMPEY